MDGRLAWRHHVPSAIEAAVGSGAIAAIAGPFDATGVIVFLCQLASPTVGYDRARRDSTVFLKTDVRLDS